MDDDFTILAVPVPDPLPADEPAAPPPPLVSDDRSEGTILLRGYDNPGEYFQPRLRANDAA